jgi:hypothetical protein
MNNNSLIVRIGENVRRRVHTCRNMFAEHPLMLSRNTDS